LRNVIITNDSSTPLPMVAGWVWFKLISFTLWIFSTFFWAFLYCGYLNWIPVITLCNLWFLSAKTSFLNEWVFLWNTGRVNLSINAFTYGSMVSHMFIIITPNISLNLCSIRSLFIIITFVDSKVKVWGSFLVNFIF